MHPREAELKAWMIAGLAGDRAAHAALLRAALPLLTTFYRRRIPGREAEVEDLVQETLIALHTRRASYDPMRPLTSWLFAIARYKLIDHWRATRQTVPLDLLGDILSIDSFEDASNARTDIDRLLDGLSPKQAAAIRATRIEGLSTAEAAARAEIGESDVKISVHRGLKTLAARLKDSLR